MAIAIIPHNRPPEGLRAALRCGRPGCPCQKPGSSGPAHCPAHDDGAPSLSVGERGGKILVHCHAGCSQDAVISALRARGLWPAGRAAVRTSRGSPRVAATYDYVDEEGQLLFQVVRFEPKAFRQRRPDGQGGWVWNTDGVRRVLYRLPEVLAAVREGREVWITEGERDADALRAAGVCATTNPGGAGKWSPEFAPVFRGARVVVVRDRDEPGHRHADQVVASLLPVAASVKLVEAREGKDATDHLAAGLRLQDFVEVPVRAQPVELGEILCQLVGLLRAAVVLPSEDAYLAVALWAIHTHVFDVFRVSPYLFVNSPTPRCGKTRVLEALEMVVARPWRVVDPTEAVLFRKIERDRPSLLLDEVDTYFRGGEERTSAVRAVLNAGNAAGVVVPRCEKNTLELREFNTFCPKAFAGIGAALPATVLDRAITITLQRASPAEQAHVDALDYDELEAQAVPIREALERWGMDPSARARLKQPVEVPQGLDARARQCWRPLLAIAREAGVLEEARRAALALSGGRDLNSEDLRTRLLGALREVFEEEGADRLPTARILEALRAREGEGWSDLTPERLARLLKPFGLGPRKWWEGGTIRGYVRADLEPVWSRYLPANPPDPPECSNDAGFGDFPTRQEVGGSGGFKNGPNADGVRVLAGLAGCPPGNGHEGPGPTPGGLDGALATYRAHVEACGRCSRTQGPRCEEGHALRRAYHALWAAALEAGTLDRGLGGVDGPAGGQPEPTQVEDRPQDWWPPEDPEDDLPDWDEPEEVPV